MPKDMGVPYQIERIEAINDCLELLDKEAKNMSERELHSNSVTKHIL